MDPFKKFNEVLRILRFTSQIIDRDIFGRKFRFTKLSLTILIFLMVILMGCCYTIKYHDQNRAFEAAITLFGLCQSFLRYIVMDDLQSLVAVLNNFSIGYKQNANRSARDHDLYNRFAKIDRLVVAVIYVVYFLVVVFYQSPKFYKYCITGVIEPTVGIYLPVVEDFEDITVVAMHILNIAGISVAAYIACVFDTTFCIVFVNMMVTPTIIKRDLQDLKLALEIRGSSRAESKSRVVKIIQTHWNFRENIKKLDYDFRRSCLCQLATATLFSVLSIFLIVKHNYAEAYVSILLGLAQIMTICFMGTLVQISSEQIQEAISAFDWYLLPPDQRKVYRFLLQHVQQEQILYIAKVKPLNMETSVGILKSIYSYAMILNSFV